MEDQKLESILNLSLEATNEERRKSPILQSGYNEADNRWDVVVKYAGDISQLVTDGIIVAVLYNEYAVLNVPESEIERLTDYPQITFIEKPKPLYFAAEAGKQAACITPVVRQGLTGKGCLVGVIDSGIDYLHSAFRNADGSTRIVSIWDQTVEGNPPKGYLRGTEYSREQIQQALDAGSRQAAYEIVNSKDVSGHGTGVAGIAAGGGRAEGWNQGVAPGSELVIVKLGTPGASNLPRTTELMMGIDYCIRKSVELNMPIAINLSYGNTYGRHDGTSLLETYIDSVTGVGRNCICIGTGNEGASGGHTDGRVTDGAMEQVELAVSGYQTGMSVQLWKSYVDEFEIAIVTPSGVRLGPLQKILGAARLRTAQTEILFYYGEPAPYSLSQEIFFSFLPTGNYIEEGVWTFEIYPRKIVRGDYQMWLPSQSALNIGTRFLRPTPDHTLTIPSTAGKAITVGAFDIGYDSYADFSGRGYYAEWYNGKPDLVAPGVNIYCPSPGGGFTTRTGTSFATPFVTGSAALLMEWAIVNGNDLFLYGEKMKAYLRSGAKRIRGEAQYPNIRVGYGALCLSETLPN